VTRSLSVEDALLLAAAGPRLSPERARRIARLGGGEPDWPRLVADAQRHGLAPFVHHHRRALGEATWPRDARDALGRSARHCVAWNLLLRHELARVLDAFGRASIDVMPLKGPVLADELYPDPFLRSTEDLDLLVRDTDVAASERILHGLGYRRLPPPEQGAGYHTGFVSDGAGAPGVVAELHHDVGEAHVSRPDVRALWAAASRGAWAGQPIRQMALVDLVVYLCFHAAKDGLASVRALLDVALLLERRCDEITWDELAVRATAAHLVGPVYLALRESRALLGAPVPDAVLQALRPRRLRWRLSQRLFRWRGGVLHVPEALLVGPVMAVLMMLWEDAPRGVLRHLRRNLLPSPGVRGHWTREDPGTSWMRWYPRWLWRAARESARQVTSRARRL
jgi:putative nucleotidyltransferase-like protein